MKHDLKNTLMQELKPVTIGILIVTVLFLLDPVTEYLAESRLWQEILSTVVDDSSSQITVANHKVI